MAELKIRADGHSLARLIMASGTVELGRDIPPGGDGWHSFSSMVDGLAVIKQRREEAQEAQRAPAVARPVTLTPAQALAEGRIHPRGVTDWEARYEADPEAVGRTLGSLAPVVSTDARTDHRRSSSTPRLDAVTEALYGADREERWRREDLQAEAELREAELSEQQQVTASGLTDDEYRSLFPAASGE